jgi:Flp pilus assembly protein TadG
MKSIQHRRERGVTFVIAAIALTSLLLATGLAVDISHVYMVKAELQNAADAGALAGAASLNSSVAGIQQAVTRATSLPNKADFNKYAVSIPTANVKFAVNLTDTFVSSASAQTAPLNMRFIRVTTAPAPVKIYLARLVLGSTLNVSATATAGQSVPLNVICGLAPVSVIDFDTPMVPGQTYTFRAAPSQGPSPGNYQILALAANGGKTVEQGLAGNSPVCAKAGQEYAVDTSPGAKSGPVRQGLNTRFDEYGGTSLNPADYPPDINIANNITYSQYLQSSPFTAPSHTGMVGRRLLIVPIIKLSEYDAGRNVVRFNRFGVFFMRSKVANGNDGDLVGEYIDKRFTVGQGTYDPSAGTLSNVLSVPVLY